MALKISKIDRKVNLKVEDGRVVDFPPGWAYVIDSANHGLISLDFSPMRRNGRDEIAGHMRDAVWSLRREAEGASIKTYMEGIKRFWLFLDASDSAITMLRQVDRKCLDQYLAWLELQTVPSGHKNAGEKISVSFKRNSYSTLKTLLVNRQRRNPNATNPLLTFPRNPFPNSNRQSSSRTSYSTEEHRAIVGALNQDLQAIHEKGHSSLPSLQVLITYLLVLAMATVLICIQN
jgi:hypothetical protein